MIHPAYALEPWKKSKNPALTHTIEPYYRSLVDPLKDPLEEPLF